MTDKTIETFLLPVSSVDDFVTLPAGPLAPIPANDARTDHVRFTALDCFDQSIKATNKLLLSTGSTLELVADDAPIAIQDAPDKIRFVQDLPDGPVVRQLQNVSPLRSLLPIGKGERYRAWAAFVDDEGKTHCRVTLVQLVTDHDRAVLVELESLRGYDESLQLVLEHVIELGATPVSCQTLYQRLFDSPYTYDPKPTIPITHDDTAFDAANRIISTHIPLMRANEFGIIADHDTEFLHDYRIHLRKIRSVLSLFKGVYESDQTEDLKRRFSALMAPTGRLRDLDVYLLERQRFYDLLPDGLHIGLDALLEQLAVRRADEHYALVKHLQSAEYQQEIKTLANMLTQSEGVMPGDSGSLPAPQYAADRIWRRYRRVRKIASSIGSHTPDDDIHELRIHCKKLRYLIEFFEPVFPRDELAAVLKTLKRLQDELGLFNDYSVQQENLSLFALELQTQRQADDLEIAQSVGALIAVLHSRQIAQRQRIFKRLKKFNDVQTDEAFKRLFKQKEPDLT